MSRTCNDVRELSGKPDLQDLPRHAQSGDKHDRGPHEGRHHVCSARARRGGVARAAPVREGSSRA
jgi:hypothetical protein